MEPEKPFACMLPECGMTFTNEDHLHVHTKKHDMVLQLGMEQKAIFVADQTPTPTRFIRNCEEVGLFQDLQSVNPFDEGFKHAMLDTKQSMISMEGVPMAEDLLHTPHPLEPADSGLFKASNQHNITISRSSSVETGVVKEYETTTISKLTNEVTTISRVVGKPDALERVSDDVSIVKHEEVNKQTVNETVYTNNVIKIQSNIEIKKDTDKVTDVIRIYEKDIPPIMSQKSIDYVVDSFTAGNVNKDITNIKGKGGTTEDSLEVYVKLPDGKQVKMKVDENKKNPNNIGTLEKLKNVITSKNINKETSMNTLPVVQLPIPSGALIPVTFVNPNTVTLFPKIPIPPFKVKPDFESVKRKIKESNEVKCVKDNENINDNFNMCGPKERRSAASKRYRERNKQFRLRQQEENRIVRDTNRRLAAENATLKLILTKHMKKCPIADDLRNFQEKLQMAEKYVNEIRK